MVDSRCPSARPWLAVTHVCLLISEVKKISESIQTLCHLIYCYCPFYFPFIFFWPQCMLNTRLITIEAVQASCQSSDDGQIPTVSGTFIFLKDVHFWTIQRSQSSSVVCGLVDVAVDCSDTAHVSRCRLTLSPSCGS